MLSELKAFQQKTGDRFAPYVVNDPTRPRRDFHGLLDNPEWSTLYIWENGAPVSTVADAFPNTLRTVQEVDLPHITIRAPSVLFSRLSAGARIPAHHGMLNARLICHLPLIVPPGCGFRVGGETREWRPGELLIFDDTVEHEAWNEGTGDRTILIFDIWRPELAQDERLAITRMFEAVDCYS
jgi:aspartyl/asparaginyl beta-hydroxylase (cupin superfamily)